MRAILIIEDKEETRRILSNNFRADYQVLTANTQEKGQDLFNSHVNNLAGIMIGACVNGSTPNTMELIKGFRETYQGPIVVVSTNINADHLFFPIGVQVVTPLRFASTKMRQQLRAVKNREDKKSDQMRTNP